MLTSSCDRLVVLTQQEEEGLLHLVAFHARCLCRDQLPLFSCESSSSQKVPSLDFVGQRHVMLSQLVVEVVMLRGIVQEGLSLSTLKAAEVAIEVIRKLDRLVILKSLVQGFEDLIEGSSLLDLLNGEVL